MKIIIIYLFATFILIAADHEGHDSNYVVKTHEDLLKYREHCTNKLSIPVDLVEKYKKWEYPDDDETHCYMQCIFEQFGFFDEHHGFDVKKIHHQLVGGEHGSVDHTDEIHRKIESCADKNNQGGKACLWAYRAGMCLLKEHLHLVQQSVKRV